jgi:hypothetical protein
MTTCPVCGKGETDYPTRFDYTPVSHLACVEKLEVKRNTAIDHMTEVGVEACRERDECIVQLDWMREYEHGLFCCVGIILGQLRDDEEERAEAAEAELANMTAQRDAWADVHRSDVIDRAEEGES